MYARVYDFRLDDASFCAPSCNSGAQIEQL